LVKKSVQLSWSEIFLVGTKKVMLNLNLKNIKGDTMISNWLLILKGMRRQTSLSDLLTLDMHYIFMHLLSNLKVSLGNNMSLVKLSSFVGLINSRWGIANLNKLVKWVSQAVKISNNRKSKNCFINPLKKNKMILNKYASNLISRLLFKLLRECNQKRNQNIPKKGKEVKF